MSDQGSALPGPGAPDGLLRLRDVVELTALSRATIYRAMNAGNFPRPTRACGTNRWPISAITAFIEECKAVRGGGGQG